MLLSSQIIHEYNHHQNLQIYYVYKNHTVGFQFGLDGLVIQPVVRATSLC